LKLPGKSIRVILESNSVHLKNAGMNKIRKLKFSFYKISDSIFFIAIVIAMSFVTSCIGNSESRNNTSLNSKADTDQQKKISAGEQSNSISENREKEKITQEKAAAWVQNHFSEYYQKYNLSCEAAIIRLVCNLLGVTELDEEDILARFPRHSTDPNIGLVMDEIDGNIYNKDGSINWKNYGAHAPVVWKILSDIFTEKRPDSSYAFEIRNLTDQELMSFLTHENNCLGAIIWVAAYADGKKPEQNERGQVAGEHVQFVSPVLDKELKMQVYDVWPWEGQPFHLTHPFNRALFDNAAIVIMNKN
jgi:hypothetical protein